MSSNLIEKIVAKVAELPDEQQQAALEYIESLEREAGKQATHQRKSLMGAFAHMKLNVTTEDIEEVRREMWRNFPREEPQS